MIDWELSIQLPDGAFPGHFGEPGSQPVIFNTGQIMHGMVAGYTQLGRQECLEAAVRAGHWLAEQQDDDGCWRKFEHNDVPHVYNTRATWALLATGLLAGEARLVAAARRNLDWALTPADALRLVRQQRLRAGTCAVHAHHRLCHPRLPRIAACCSMRSATWQAAVVAGRGMASGAARRRLAGRHLPGRLGRRRQLLLPHRRRRR